MKTVYVIMYHTLDETHYPVEVFKEYLDAEAFIKDHPSSEIESYDIQETPFSHNYWGK